MVGGGGTCGAPGGCGMGGGTAGGMPDGSDPCGGWRLAGAGVAPFSPGADGSGAGAGGIMDGSGFPHHLGAVKATLLDRVVELCFAILLTELPLHTHERGPAERSQA